MKGIIEVVDGPLGIYNSIGYLGGPSTLKYNKLKIVLFIGKSLFLIKHINVLIMQQFEFFIEFLES
jgi:hypothetical protein